MIFSSTTLQQVLFCSLEIRKKANYNNYVFFWEIIFFNNLLAHSNVLKNIARLEKEKSSQNNNN